MSIWRAAANLSSPERSTFRAGADGRTKRSMRVHIARSVIVTIMAFLFFWGIGRVPLAQAIALTFIAPLIALILASVFLHEQIGRRSILGVDRSLRRRGDHRPWPGEVAARPGCPARHGRDHRLGAMLCREHRLDAPSGARRKAARDRLLPGDRRDAAVAACHSVAGVPAWPGGQWSWIAVASILSTAGTLLFAWGYARGEASYLAVTEYSAFLWASALGWLVFRERVSFYTLAGSGPDRRRLPGCGARARSPRRRRSRSPPSSTPAG